MPERCAHGAHYHFGVPPGALKWCKIASVRLLSTAVRPRSLRKANKCSLGGSKVPKVVKKEPKRRQNGGKIVPKITLFQKSAECEFDPLFTIYKPHRDLPKRHFFFPWRGLKEGAHHVVPPMSPWCCKMMIKGLKNAQSGALWKAKGSPRGSECLQKVSKKSSKIELGCRDASWECPRYPQASPNHNFSYKSYRKLSFIFLGLHRKKKLSYVPDIAA